MHCRALDRQACVHARLSKAESLIGQKVQSGLPLSRPNLDPFHSVDRIQSNWSLDLYSQCALNPSAPTDNKTVLLFKWATSGLVNCIGGTLQNFHAKKLSIALALKLQIWIGKKQLQHIQSYKHLVNYLGGHPKIKRSILINAKNSVSKSFDHLPPPVPRIITDLACVWQYHLLNHWYLTTVTLKKGHRSRPACHYKNRPRVWRLISQSWTVKVSTYWTALWISIRQQMKMALFDIG